MKPNFRLTTDSDVEVVANGGTTTTFSVNCSLHPKDIEKIQDIFIDFLLNNCQKTNEQNQETKSDYENYKKEEL